MSSLAAQFGKAEQDRISLDGHREGGDAARPTSPIFPRKTPQLAHAGIVRRFDLQGELAAANWEIPIIFVTGHGDIPMSVRAMKAGAIEFLTKPFRDQDRASIGQLTT